MQNSMMKTCKNTSKSGRSGLEKEPGKMLRATHISVVIRQYGISDLIV
jgi:hypothetical protein